MFTSTTMSRFHLGLLTPSSLFLLCACVVTLVNSSEEGMSACRAFCQRNHDTLDGVTMCMETLCPNMYRQRVGRFGKRTASMGEESPAGESDSSMSICESHCRLKHWLRRWEPGQNARRARLIALNECVADRCRNMYRQRVSRFGKRSVNDLVQKLDTSAMESHLESIQDSLESIADSESEEASAPSIGRFRTLYSASPVWKPSPELIKLMRNLQ